MTLLVLMLTLEQMAIATETVATALSLGDRRQVALQEARAGRFEIAIPAFVAMTKEAPNDMGIQADYIEVLTWAKKDQEALAHATHLDTANMPSYGLSALAKAARNTKQYSTSIDYYTQLIAREPNQVDYQVGKTLALIDAGRFDEAESSITTLRQQYPNHVEVYRALAYFGQQTKQPVLEVDANTRILSLNPQDEAAAKALIRSAREAGATAQALALAKQYPNAANNNEIAKIHNDNAAQYIAWGRYPSKLPADRFADTDQALAKLDEACQCDWNTLELNTYLQRNLVFDRMVALRNRYRMQEVITHYQQLQQAKVELPAYVLNAVGDAYLYLRKPEEAIKAYDASLLLAPDVLETKFSKFYTLVELEQFDAATTLIDEVSNSLTAYRQRPNNRVVRSEDNKLEADSKAYYLRAYGDDLATAEQRFQALNDVGPANNEVRMALGEIWRWRGWPNRAEQRFIEVTQDYPELLLPKVNLANSRLDLRDWQLAESEIEPLVEMYPENSAVQLLDRRWMLRNERQLVVDGIDSTYSGSAFGSRSQAVNAVLYSRPINYNYRAFVSTRYEHATFPEGTGNIFYPGIGLEYTDRDWRITGQVSQGTISNIGTTAAVTADYRLDDYWLFGGALAVNATQMPLRGLNAGISGDMMNAYAVHRWSDLARASVNVGYMDMSDGNQRKILNLATDLRLITRPHYKLTTHLRLDASQNTERNTIYYNPERDLETSVIMDNEWLLWRRYERSFGHRLQVGTGHYWQKNFGSDYTWLVSYEQQFRWDDRFEIDYGVTRFRHPFDGVNEYITQYFARLNLLF